MYYWNFWKNPQAFGWSHAEADHRTDGRWWRLFAGGSYANSDSAGRHVRTFSQFGIAWHQSQSRNVRHSGRRSGAQYAPYYACDCAEAVRHGGQLHNNEWRGHFRCTGPTEFDNIGLDSCEPDTFSIYFSPNWFYVFFLLLPIDRRIRRKQRSCLRWTCTRIAHIKWWCPKQ